MNTLLADEKTKITEYGTEGVELLVAAFIQAHWMEFTAWAGTHGVVNHAVHANWAQNCVGDRQLLIGPCETVAGQGGAPCPVS